MKDRSPPRATQSPIEGIPHGRTRAKLSADHQGVAPGRLQSLWDRLQKRWKQSRRTLAKELTAKKSPTFQDWIDALAEAVHAVEADGVEPEDVAPPSARSTISEYEGTNRQLYAALLVFTCWVRDLNESATQSSLARQAERASLTPRALKNLLMAAGQASEQESGDSKVKRQVEQLVDQLRGRRMRLGIDSELLDDAAVCLAILAHEEVRKPVVDLLRSYMRCVSHHDKDETPWRKVWLGTASEYLQVHSARMGKLAIGELHVDQHRARGFWRSEVMETVEKSLWTTNISYNKGLFGRAADRDLLRAQQQAIESGVEITRLFVYDPEAAEEDFNALRVLMRAQLEIGIIVMTISKNDFLAAENGRVSYIGGEDFMILDDKYVYVTKTDLPGAKVISASLTNDQEAILSAKLWRRESMISAQEWHSATIDEFPGE